MPLTLQPIRADFGGAGKFLKENIFQRSDKGPSLDVSGIFKHVEDTATSTGVFHAVSVTDSRTRHFEVIIRRRGHPRFRQALMRAYGGKCAITRCDAPEVLVAFNPAALRVSLPLLDKGMWSGSDRASALWMIGFEDVPAERCVPLVQRFSRLVDHQTRNGGGSGSGAGGALRAGPLCDPGLVLHLRPLSRLDLGLGLARAEHRAVGLRHAQGGRHRVPGHGGDHE